MIRVEGKTFYLNTKNTTYAFRVLETGQLEHLYYGSRITEAKEISVIQEQRTFAPGNTVVYDNEHGELSLEDVRLETSAIGKGDFREPMVEVVCPDGSTSLDFVYENHEILAGKKEFKTLPGSYGNESDVDTLNVKLVDKNNGYTLLLSYFVYEKTDVITRAAKFINTSDDSVKITRMLSMLMDFDESGYKITSFHGRWTNEMNKSDMILPAGKYVNSSFTGTSSNRTNPFFILSEADSTETSGDVYGYNLIYSGNHYGAVEVSPWGKTRVAYGINPQNFSWTLEAGEEFEAPEAVMTYSDCGFRKMSLNMHEFVRNHITRGYWKDKERPILINSWEAAYFNFNESSLLKLAKQAKKVGIELFVMDDGWFGDRNDDHRALGDWDIVNEKKLPGGLEGLSKKINDLGLSFGLWVEPEMINVDSKLYEKHPQWAIDIPGKNHSEGRTQRLLDLCNPEVVEYLTQVMSEVFATPGLSYVKWDFNRNFSDYYSKYLEPSKQLEVGHRYVLGLYKLLGALTKEFPEILIEGCASGGNRFDLGMLCYCPQIWASDNTDALSRLNIQEGYSYGYPQSTYTAHVSSCPNHQTLRVTPMETRFAVASFGVLGYELNLCDMNNEDLAATAAEIELYKKYRRTLQYGDFYRLLQGNTVEWSIVDKDKTTAVTMVVQKEMQAGIQYLRIKQAGLDATSKYHFFGRKLEYNLKGFGDLVNTVAPIHIKQDGLIHNMVAKFVKMPGELEDYTASGDVLNNAGVKLKQNYVGTGYNEQVRYFPDYGSRLYFAEKE